MERKILAKLKEIENEKDIKILFAVESGSRAWGFASPDSDYDIRFVYKHQKNWYLSLWEHRDSIEFITEDNLDGSGWDIKKALLLLAKSNASLTEWLFSPIVYKADSIFLEEIKKLAKNNFNPIAGFHHYHSMSKSFEEALATDKMTLKSFFYTIRTAFCANWIIKKGTIPPVLFKDLYELIEMKYHTMINDLIQLKSERIEEFEERVPNQLIQLVKNIIEENNILRNQLVNKKANHQKFNKFFLENL